MMTVAEILGAALAHYQSGRRDLAIEWLGRALRLDPNIPAIHNNLGVALAEEGRLAEAAASFCEAVRLEPESAQAHCNLGNALREQGLVVEAETSLREALRLRPSYPEAHFSLGLVLKRAGKLREAAVSFESALHLKPDYADAHYGLAGVLRTQGYPEKATDHLRRVVHLRPADAKAHGDLGVVLAEQTKLPEAVVSFQEALRLKPDSAEAHNNLGNALREHGHPEEGVFHLQEALRLSPGFAEAHNNLGLALREQNRLEEARDCLKRALNLKPQYASAHANLGYLLEDLGDLAAAAAAFREALRHEPLHAGALSSLATLLRSSLSESDLNRMQQLLAEAWLGEHERCRLNYGLAHALDARRAYDRAAAHFQVANGIEAKRWRKRGLTYDPAEVARFVERLEQTFTRAFFERVRGWGLPSERPVFVFGLPRSGTTLTEQILASHSQVHGGGELHFAQDDFQALAQMAGTPVPPVPQASAAAAHTARKALQREQALAALERLGQAALQRLAQQHLTRLENLNGTAARLTSKTPANWQFVGLMAALFPRARFIHCRRDLRDVALSCWTTHFQHLSWTCAFDHIAAHFKAYRRLMDHWGVCLPVPMLEIDYEETVADLESTARRLVSWLDLDWEPACLNFHQTNRPVRTASAVQVRQPLYRSSVGRWRHYATALEPLFAKLGGLDSGRTKLMKS